MTRLFLAILLTLILAGCADPAPTDTEHGVVSIPTVAEEPASGSPRIPSPSTAPSAISPTPVSSAVADPTPRPTPEPTPAPRTGADIQILSHSNFVNSIGTFHVFGEIQNKGPQHAQFVKVTATFYNESGGIVGTGLTFPDPSTLLSGETTFFDVFDPAAKNIATYRLSVTSTPTSIASTRLTTIRENNSYVDSIDSRHILGEVVNTGDRNLEFVKVIATFYDSKGQAVDGDMTYIRQDVLRPGEAGVFELITLGDDPGSNYRLVVEGRTTSQEPVDVGQLTIVSNASLPAQGYSSPRILGEIRNDGTRTAMFVEVTAVMYDASGRLIDTDFTYTSPSEIAPGQTAPFEMSVLRKDAQVASYRLLIEVSRFA